MFVCTHSSFALVWQSSDCYPMLLCMMPGLTSLFTHAPSTALGSFHNSLSTDSILKLTQFNSPYRTTNMAIHSPSINNAIIKQQLQLLQIKWVLPQSISPRMPRDKRWVLQHAEKVNKSKLWRIKLDGNSKAEDSLHRTPCREPPLAGYTIELKNIR